MESFPMSETTFKTWMLMTYDISNWFRSCLSILNGPFKPSDKGPIYSISRSHRQKWVEFKSLGCSEVRVGFGSETVTIKRNI